ncbi:rifin, partial [Plasmodium reichenowi]
GCGLGSVAGSVGLFGGIIINIWKPGALKAAIAAAIAKRAAEISIAAEAAGEVTGKALVIAELQKMGISTLNDQTLQSFFTTISYKNITRIYQAVYEQHFQKCEFGFLKKEFLSLPDAKRDLHFCRSVWNQTPAASQARQYISPEKVIKTTVEEVVEGAEVSAKAAADIATKQATEASIKTSTETIDAACTQLYSAIGY